MNKYKLFFTCAASLLLMSSCYDLDRYPEDQLSAGTFFQTQDHADQAMMGVYSQMTHNDVFGRQFCFDCLGGVGAGYDAPSYPNIGRGTYTTTEGAVGDKFKQLYEGVTRANIVLQNVDQCDMSDELKTRYKSEARFMRALYYFTLLDFWGGVPIYDETTIVAEDFSNMLKPRSSAEEVRTFIIKDLDEAIAHLPADWDESNKGRATSGAAMALKGKVLLYNKQYQEAATCFENVINSGKYALYSDYENLFKPGGDESSEMIFAIQNIGGVGTDFCMPMTFYMGSRASYGSCWNNVMAATDFVDSYEWKDGRAFDWNEVIPGFNENDAVKKETFYATLNEGLNKVATYPAAKDKLLEMYNKRDPRMMASIIMPYTTYKGWYSNAPMDTEYVITEKSGQTNEKNGFIRVNGNYEMYLWRKFVAEYDMNGAINNREDTPINFPLIRYADVLLMYAECLIETGGDKQLAADLINQVRYRAFVTTSLTDSYAKYRKFNLKESDRVTEDTFNAKYKVKASDDLRAAVRHERRIELAGEGLRFYDLIRWGTFVSTMQKFGKTDEGKYSGAGTLVTDKTYPYPIPQSEIDYVGGALTQNDNY